MGNSNDPSAWAAAPQPASVNVRKGEGVEGSDRITLVWPGGAIQKQWLQVTVLATSNTALAADDVLYFGNAIGETGNSTTDANVNAFDMLGARDNPTSFLNALKLITVPISGDKATGIPLGGPLVVHDDPRTAATCARGADGLPSRLGWLYEFDVIEQRRTGTDDGVSVRDRREFDPRPRQPRVSLPTVACWSSD